ncbi:tetratricopeptide repeat protein [Sphingomonas adhaesiva]|uniref:tetratricopeptide repeat protein n=1 Tax=Sphingomonas adhaesiva TaxID=28212 RepID=UPI002FF5C429
MLLTLLLAQALAPAEQACLAQARRDPARAEQVARNAIGGSARMRQCLGLALVGQDRFADAAAAFAEAARAAELAKDEAAADYWAQSGNAWLAAGEAAKARTALDAALAAGTLTDLQRGEAYLDRARALVATGDVKAARTDLDQALMNAADDPLAWLLSATLARRGGDLTRARADIAQALRRSPDDASVQLEAGNTPRSRATRTRPRRRGARRYGGHPTRPPGVPPPTRSSNSRPRRLRSEISAHHDPRHRSRRDDRLLRTAGAEGGAADGE